MEDWGELTLMYLDEVDPTAVWGMDLVDVIDTFRAGGFTRTEAGAVARWLFACLPPQSSDGSRRMWLSADDPDEGEDGESDSSPPPTVH
jgi:hypothetical protein